MKRSVFIFVLFLAGFNFSVPAPAPITSLPVAQCDALSVKPKALISVDPLQLSHHRFHKRECAFEPLKNKPPHTQNHIKNEPVFVVPESGDIKLLRNPLPVRKKITRSKPYFTNHPHDKVKVPP